MGVKLPGCGDADDAREMLRPMEGSEGLSSSDEGALNGGSSWGWLKLSMAAGRLSNEMASVEAVVSVVGETRRASQLALSGVVGCSMGR